MSSLILTETAELLLFKFEFSVENSPRAITHFERSSTSTLVFSCLSLVKRGQVGGFKCHKWHSEERQKNCFNYLHSHIIHLSNVKCINMRRLPATTQLTQKYQKVSVENIRNKILTSRNIPLIKLSSLLSQLLKISKYLQIFFSF